MARKSEKFLELYGNISVVIPIFSFIPFVFLLVIFSWNQELSFLKRSFIGYDLLLGSIAAFYVLMVPYTKVEESFNVQVQVHLYFLEFFSLSF